MIGYREFILMILDLMQFHPCTFLRIQMLKSNYFEMPSQGGPSFDFVEGYRD